MEELIVMYIGFAKATAEREKARTQHEMSKTITASQRVGDFMDFFERLKASDEDTTMEEAIKQYNEIIAGIRK